MTTTYRMLYVGKGLYNVAQFETEAAKSGVARAVKADQLKRMSWSDPVLLAQWLPDTAAQRATMTFQETFEPTVVGTTRGLRFKRFGKAEVFGYFRVTGLNMAATPRMKSELLAKLDVVETVDHGPGGARVVKRRCGSYGVQSTSYVRDTIAEILGKAAVIEEAHGLKFRWFACGGFEPLVEMSLDPARFSRGIIKIDMDIPSEQLFEGSLPEGDDARPKINYILDYERKTYQKKGEQ